MDRLIIERKLDSLRRCLARVVAKRPATVAALAADADLQMDCVPTDLTRAARQSPTILVSPR